MNEKQERVSVNIINVLFYLEKYCYTFFRTTAVFHKIMHIKI